MQQFQRSTLFVYGLYLLVGESGKIASLQHTDKSSRTTRSCFI